MVVFKLVRLKLYNGKTTEKYKPSTEIPLWQGHEMNMNRNNDSETDIQLLSPNASRRHAILLHREGLHLEVKDLNTVNGTYINGTRVEADQWVPLKHNDVLGIGYPSSTEFDEYAYFFQVIQVDRPNTRSTNPPPKPKEKCSTKIKNPNENNECKITKKKEDLKRKADQMEQTLTRKSSLAVTNGTTPTDISTKPTKRKKVQDDSKIMDNNAHVLIERNKEVSPPNSKDQMRKSSLVLSNDTTTLISTSTKLIKRKKAENDSKQQKLVTTDNTITKITKRKKVQVNPKVMDNSIILCEKNKKVPPTNSKNSILPPSKVKHTLSKVTIGKKKSKPVTVTSTSCITNNQGNSSPRNQRSTNKVEDVLESLQLENDTASNGEFPEPLQSTQELLSIMDSQAAPEFQFKMPSIPSSSVLDNIKNVFDAESNEEELDLNIAPNSTQDLRNILMDSQDSVDDNSNTNNISAKKVTPKKIFKNLTRSPSKKPKFNFSLENFFDEGSVSSEKKRASTSLKMSKKETTPRNSIGVIVPSTSKCKNNVKSRKPKSVINEQVPKQTRDISEIVSDVDDSQLMSQYSMTEDDIIETMYDVCTAASSSKMEPLVHEENNMEDEDIGWLKELSQSYDDSCALVINEEPLEGVEDDSSPRQSTFTNSSFAFIKEDQQNITFDDEPENSATTDSNIATRSGIKSFEEVQDKIKTKHAVKTKPIEIVEPPVMKSETLRRSKRSSESRGGCNSNNFNKSPFSTTGLSYYCRSVDESPKFMRTSLKQEAIASRVRPTLKSAVKTKAVRQVNFQSDAEQVQFDDEATSCTVKHTERQMIKLNTNPSVFKTVSMENQSIKHTISDMYRTNAGVETHLGDNIHVLCWLCNWLPQQNINDHPPPVYKGIPLDDHAKGKHSYSSITDYYNTLEPLLYYQVWSDMFSQYARDRRPRIFILHKDSVEYVPTTSIQSSRKKLYRLKCTIKNATSKYLSEKQLLHLTFNPVHYESYPSFECFAYVNHIDKVSNNTSFNLHMTLSVVSEKDLTVVPTSEDINAHILTKVDINHYKMLPRRYIRSHMTPIFLNPDSVLEPMCPIKVRDMLQNVGTCTLKQKHVVSTFLDVCLERNRKLALVDGLAGTGKTVAIVKAIENLLLYTKPSRTHRILLVSSNVGSLDEISSQLINLRKSLPSSELKEKIKFLRLDESQDAEVRTYSCNEFIQSELKRFKKEAMENPGLMARTRQDIKECIASEQNKSSPYCLTLEKALKDVDSYLASKVLSKDFMLYFFKTKKKLLIAGADVVCCSLKELCNVESCNYININSQKKSTVCIVEDAHLSSDLDTSLLLQLQINKLVLVGDSTVDVILPFACLYKSKFHFTLFKRLIQAKAVGHKQNIPVIQLDQIHRGTTLLKQNIKRVLRRHTAHVGEAKSSSVQIMEWCMIDHRVEGVQESAHDKNIRVKYRDEEAILVVNIATEVKHKYQHLSVVIITPYDVQKSIIMKALSNKTDESLVPVFTVLEFTGRQADVVIFSTKLPYALTSNVLEVVFTRAKSSLIIVGNFSEDNAKHSFTKCEWTQAMQISKSSRTLRYVDIHFDWRNEKQTLGLILK